MRYATPSLLLAVIGTFSRLPSRTATPLLLQLLHAPGQFGDSWHKLLPEVVEQVVPEEGRGGEDEGEWLAKCQQLDVVVSAQQEFSCDAGETTRNRRDALQPAELFSQEESGEWEGGASWSIASPVTSNFEATNAASLVLLPSSTHQPPGLLNQKELDELRQVLPLSAPPLFSLLFRSSPLSLRLASPALSSLPSPASPISPSPPPALPPSHTPLGPYAISP